MIQIFFALAILYGSCLAQSDENVRLRCYKRDFYEYKDYTFEKAEDLLRSDCYDPHKRLVFYTHGYKGRADGAATKEVVSTFLETGCCNVILLDWEKLAEQGSRPAGAAYFLFASPNAKQIARDFSKVLSTMIEGGVKADSVWLIGHSLGAQLFGIAGSYLQRSGVLLSRITGLDPASLGYEGGSGVQNLNKKSAKFVEIIHTDPNKYGYRRAYGTVDFWPNFMPGNFYQPGCIPGNHPQFSDEDLCNHNRSWQYLVDALRYPKSVMATKARNYQAWKSYRGDQLTVDILHLGEKPDRTVSGNYFFTTNDKSPFGRGMKGLLPK